MAKIYKVTIKPKNCIILNGKVYYADNEYELTMTDKQVVAYKPYMEIINHLLIGEETISTVNEITTKKRTRQQK